MIAVSLAHADILSALAHWTRTYDESPSHRDLARYLRVSLAHVSKALEWLRLRGIVWWTRGKARTLVLTPARWVAVESRAEGRRRLAARRALIAVSARRRLAVG